LSATYYEVTAMPTLIPSRGPVYAKLNQMYPPALGSLQGNRQATTLEKKALALVKTVAKCLLQRLANVRNRGVAWASGDGSGQPLE
jgi:hypothetical protein